MRFVARVAGAAAGRDDELTIEVTGAKVTLAVFTPGADAVTETGLALAGRIEG